jgi:hypothetical protein
MFSGSQQRHVVELRIIWHFETRLCSRHQGSNDDTRYADFSTLNHLTCIIARERLIEFSRLDIFRSNRRWQYDAWHYGDSDGRERGEICWLRHSSLKYMITTNIQYYAKVELVFWWHIRYSISFLFFRLHISKIMLGNFNACRNFT